MTRPAYRLGLGGDYRPRGVDPQARVTFLRAVERLVPETLTELQTLNPDDEKALQAWCTRRGFVAVPSARPDWWRETARRTAIYLQSKTPNDPTRFQVAFSFLDAKITIVWDYLTEPEKAFAGRVAKIRQEVARRPDLERVRRIHSARAFGWLARYQVAGDTFAAIAERGDRRSRHARFITREAVRDAVRRLAADVGIALPRVARGRPKKRRPPR